MTAVSREQFIQDAKTLEGVPFKHQGRDPLAGGIDCIHAPAYLFRLQGYELPFEMPLAYLRDSHDYKLIEAILDEHFIKVTKEEARAGDLYLFKPALKMRHIGIRITDDEPPLLLQPSSQPRPGYPEGRVTVEPFSDRWISMFRAAYRFPFWSEDQ